jgi:hypothetical protein
MTVYSTQNPNPLFDNDSAAEYIGDHPRTLANKRSRGEGPDYVKIGRKVRYQKSALDRYLQLQTVRLNDSEVAS